MANPVILLPTEEIVCPSQIVKKLRNVPESPTACYPLRQLEQRLTDFQSDPQSKTGLEQMIQI